MDTASTPITAPHDTRGIATPLRPRAMAAWSSVLVLSGGHFAVDFCTGIWPVFKTLAHLDIAKAGLIATAGSMAGNGLQVVFGLLADRGWRKPLMVAGVSVAGAVTLVPWAVRSYPLMFALVAITYVGSAAYHPSGTGAAGAISRTRTGFMVGLFLAGGYGGYSVSQLIFSAVYGRSPAATPFMTMVPLAAAVGISVLVPAAAPRSHQGTWSTLRPQLSSLSALFCVQVFATAINVSLIFLLPDLLLARHAPDWMVQGGGHFALVAGACLSLIPAGHAADSWGARRVLLVANTATGVLLAWLLSRGQASFVDLGIVTLFGGCNGMNNVVAVAEGNRMFAGRASGVSALLMGLPWFFAASALTIAGILADPSRGGTPAAALGWLGMAIPLALVSSVFVRPRASSSARVALDG